MPEGWLDKLPNDMVFTIMDDLPVEALRSLYETSTGLNKQVQSYLDIRRKTMSDIEGNPIEGTTTPGEILTGLLKGQYFRLAQSESSLIESFSKIVPRLAEATDGGTYGDGDFVFFLTRYAKLTEDTLARMSAFEKFTAQCLADGRLSYLIDNFVTGKVVPPEADVEKVISEWAGNNIRYVPD